MKLNSQLHYYNACPEWSSELTAFLPDFIFTYIWAIELTAKLIPKQSSDLSPKCSGTITGIISAEESGICLSFIVSGLQQLQSYDVA